MISAYLHSVAEVLSELHERGFYPDCSSLVTDHRRLTGLKDVFLAVPGEKFDPRSLADDLLHEQRCGLVLVEYDAQRSYQSAGVLPVLHLKNRLAEIACAYYNNPSDALTVIAVTGTNGKTTVTRWLAQALNELGHQAAVVGTLGYGKPDALKAYASLTTPDAVGIHHVLHELRQQQFDTVCLEASSIGLEQNRLAFVSIDVAVFTNLSQDHLDYHGDMQAYGRAKLLLAAWPTLRSAVVNVGDALGLEFQALVKSRSVACVSVGRDHHADCHLMDVVRLENGQQILLNNAGEFTTLQTSVIGDFNADNMALVFAVLLQLNCDIQKVVAALSRVTSAPGRMQLVATQPFVIVDYAHTPDALAAVLRALGPVARQRQGKLWVVFGCGGERDRGKRPLMGAIAALNADVVLITSDNPRGESPQAILDEIYSGVQLANVGKVRVEVDRVKAIEVALCSADDGDVVVVAGKGHEQTQFVGGQMIAHSDVRCVQSVLLRRGVHV